MEVLHTPRMINLLRYKGSVKYNARLTGGGRHMMIPKMRLIRACVMEEHGLGLTKKGRIVSHQLPTKPSFSNWGVRNWNLFPGTFHLQTSLWTGPDGAPHNPLTHPHPQPRQQMPETGACMAALVSLSGNKTL